jgi:hypothetical protein
MSRREDQHRWEDAVTSTVCTALPVMAENISSVTTCFSSWQIQSTSAHVLLCLHLTLP